MATATLSRDIDILEVWKTYKADQENKEIRNFLVERYLPLVKYNGERIWSRLPEGVELDDLISAGVFGLMDAIDAFDLSRGVKPLVSVQQAGHFLASTTDHGRQLSELA